MRAIKGIKRQQRSRGRDPYHADRPVGITRGGDGALWFVEIADGQIGRITPDGAVAEFQLPDRQAAGRSREKP